ncbi:MAG: NIPSNAP family protein [Acidobacteria bacterium]|nr:NIPSNAP family protein [Acidobacteriota bacterium]MBI3472505.1 NIPSNAP family protein [Candidatus Solibacter usitatus]
MKKLAIFCAGILLGAWLMKNDPAAAAAQRVFELRTYTTEEGKLDALNARFRNHTIKLFEKHGMANIGYWVPQDEPRSKNTLVYIVSHASRDAAKKSWDAFRADPDWVKARDESEKGGKIVAKVESVFLSPTDYSKIK